MPSKPLDQLSPKYRQRIERAMARGKSRQEARGHRPGEHVERRQREEEEYGLTHSEMATIRAWCGRYKNETRDADDVIEFARENGYGAFKTYRAVWEAARRQYLRELLSGEYASRGEQYLEYLAGTAGVDDVSWLYYH